MSAGWVAGSVRGRLLLGRRLGLGPALDLARAGTPGEAISLLAASPYGLGAEPPEDVAAAPGRSPRRSSSTCGSSPAGCPAGVGPSAPWPAGSSS